MYLRPISDLHLNHLPPEEEFTLGPHFTDPIGTLIIAGDLDHFRRVPEILKAFGEDFENVLFVPGNHEYYFNDIYDLRKYWTGLDLGPRIHILDRKSVEINGIVFIGATLWTNFSNGITEVMKDVASRMADFEVISYRGEIFTPEKCLELHREDLGFIRDQLELHRDKPRVVITHHAPSYNSVSPPFQGSPLGPGFNSHLDPVIVEFEPNYWFHGHTHSFFDYHIGPTRVVCNPHGYKYYETQKDFFPHLYFEI